MNIRAISKGASRRREKLAGRHTVEIIHMVIPSTLARLGEHSSLETIDATRRSFGKEEHAYISVEHRLTAKLYTRLNRDATS